MFRLLPILTIVVVACIGGCHHDAAESSDTGASPAACPVSSTNQGSPTGVAADAASPAADAKCSGGECQYEGPASDCPLGRCQPKPKCCPSQAQAKPAAPAPAKANE